MKTILVYLTILLIGLLTATLFCSNDSIADEFKARYGNDFVIKMNKKLNVPRLIYGKGIPLTNAEKFTPINLKNLTKEFLHLNKDFLYISMDDIKIKSIRHISDNWSIKFQQYYCNIPVEGGIVGISVTDNGFINLIGNGYFPNINLSINPNISSEAANTTACNQYTEPQKAELQSIELAILPLETNDFYVYKLAWKVALFYHVNILDSKVLFIDAQTGEILKKQNLVMKNGISGEVQGHIWLNPPIGGNIPPSTIVYYPDLVVKIYGTGTQEDVTDLNGIYNLSQGMPGLDRVYSTFENENIKLQVYQYAAPGHSIDEYLSYDYSWTWDDTSNHGGEYNVFYWLNYMHRYFGNNFNYDILEEDQVIVDMYGSSTCAWGPGIMFNDSPYPVRNKFTICHEYTHSIHGDIGLPCNYDTESGAFVEGNADYYPCSIHNEPDWHADENDHLDVLVYPYLYEHYVEGVNPHVNGKIIARAMWTFRTQLDDAILADGLILEAMNVLSNFPDLADYNAKVFSDFVTALLIADDNDGNPINGTPNQNVIFSSFGETHHIYPDGYIVSGSIAGNTTWTCETYITDDVTVLSGVTLTIIDEGNIKFASGTKLTINGTLTAQGTSSNHITFTSASATPHKGDWNWIKFGNAAGNSSLNYCDIEYAKTGIWCYGAANPTIQNCEIKNCSQYGARIENNEDKTIFRYNKLRNNSIYGIFLMTSYPTLLSITANNNGYSGLFCFNSSPKLGSIDTMSVNQSQFSYNSQHGIWCTGSSGSHPNIYRNSTTNPDGGYVQLIGNNSGNGLRAENYSKPNLGSSSSSKGNNSIYNNSSYEIYNNNSSNLLQARHNWWGSSAGPPTGAFYGNVRAIPYLKYPPGGSVLAGYNAMPPMVANNPIDTPDELVQQGEIYLAEGELEKALEIFEQVMYDDTKSEYAKNALSGIVLCYRELGWKDMIVSYLDKITDQYHNQELGYWAIVQSLPWLEQHAKYDEALKRCELLRNEYQLNKDVYNYLLFQMGMIYKYGLKETELANNAFAEFINDYPDNPLAVVASAEMQNYGTSQPLFKDKGIQLVVSEAEVPEHFSLHQNYPNPFNPETEIRYQLPEAVHVSLEIYNLLGQKIRTLVDENKQAGYHTTHWDGSNDFGNAVASGVYLYVLKAGEFSDVKKMILMR